VSPASTRRGLSKSTIGRIERLLAPYEEQLQQVELMPGWGRQRSEAGRPLELDELVEHFTLLPDEVALLRNKSGPTRLGFTFLLKFFTHRGRSASMPFRAAENCAAAQRWSLLPGSAAPIAVCAAYSPPIRSHQPAAQASSFG